MSKDSWKWVWLGTKNTNNTQRSVKTNTELEIKAMKSGDIFGPSGDISSAETKSPNR